MPTLKELLRYGHRQLEKNSPSPILDAEVLLAWVLKKPKIFLYAHPEQTVAPKIAQRYKKIISQRKQGLPVAYLTGFKEFYGLKFYVNKSVLIPRPETELIVDRMLFSMQGHDLPPPPPDQEGRESGDIKILDVGTGSGAIIISLAKTLKDKSHKLKPTFYASDISAAALRVAKQNAKQHNVKIKFIKSDLFKNIKGNFDIISANLPYVTLKDYRSRIYPVKCPDLSGPGFAGFNRVKDLRYEPKKALTDGTNHWEIFKKFFQQISTHLNSDSLILLEIDPSSKKLLTYWAKKYLPQAKIKFYRDLQNHLRVMEIRTI